jgi:hypothetical protein
LARSATREALTENRVFQNDERLASASRLSRFKRGRQFFRSFNIVLAYDSNPAASGIFSPLQYPTRSVRMNGRS